jgi:flagellar basal body-associated protein FliL
MTDTDTQALNLKTILLLIVVAIVMAVVVTLVQTLILGKANVAITGGVVGHRCSYCNERKTQEG